MTHLVTARHAASRLRGGWPRRAALAAAAASALLLLAPLSPAQASARAFGKAQTVAPPADTNVPQQTGLDGVACLGAGNCLAGGSYETSAHNYEPMVARQTNGTWSKGVKLALPKNAFTPPAGGISAVACVSAGNCTAVGSYGGPGNYIAALIVTQSQGAWKTGISPALPADAASNHVGLLNWVACTPTGFCEAIGNYLDSLGKWQTMAITKPAGSGWKQAVKVAPPADASGGTLTYMESISCVSAGNCVAAGYYSTNSSAVQPMGAVESSGHWHTAVHIATPGNAAPSGAAVYSISCGGSTCHGAGSYYLTGGVQRAMTVTESAGAFGKGVGVTAVPSGASANPDTALYGISCAPTTPCVAVGTYTNTAGHSVPMYLLASGSGWTAKSEQQPANASTGSNQDGSLDGVACLSSGHCTAVGSYLDTSGGYRAEAASS